jgi:hypothetical protein
METGLKAFKDTMAAAVGANLASGDRRAIGRRYWNTHKGFLKSISDDEVVLEHSLADWAAAPLEQKEQRQTNHMAAKNKCVQEKAALAKIKLRGSWWIMWAIWRAMPMWSDGNKESVEAHAIELRHKLPCPTPGTASG